MLTVSEVLAFSDPAGMRHARFLAACQSRLETLRLSIVAIRSVGLDGCSIGEPFPAELAVADSVLPQQMPEGGACATHRIGGRLTAICVSFEGLMKVEGVKNPWTTFIVASDHDVPSEMGILLQRLYQQSILQECARLRRDTVDPYLKVQNSAEFWPQFAKAINASVPFDSAQILASETLSATPHLLFPPLAYRANDDTPINARDVKMTSEAALALDDLMKSRRPAVFSILEDPIVGPLSPRPNRTYQSAVYCPLIAMGRKLRQGGELRIGGAIRFLDPLTRDSKRLHRTLTWEDGFILAFAAEVCAVLMNNYFVKNAETAALQRISHGFTATLNAIISNSIDVSNELAQARRFLLPQSTTDFVSARQSVEMSADRTQSIAAWAEEMWQQVLFESRMYELFAVDGDQAGVDVRTINDFSREIIGRVFRTVKSLREKYQRKWVTLPNHYDALQFMPKVKGDPILLRAVFRNLLENSIKYTRAHEPEIVIGLSFKVVGDFVHINFSDNGIGITNDERARIFKGQYRSERAVNCKVEGKGLGLMQAKAFLERMKSDITVEPAPVGALLMVKLPIAR